MPKEKRQKTAHSPKAGARSNPYIRETSWIAPALWRLDNQRTSCRDL